jgi:hypothetical protein
VKSAAATTMTGPPHRFHAGTRGRIRRLQTRYPEAGSVRTKAQYRERDARAMNPSSGE